jgi:hypothetical protein
VVLLQLVEPVVRLMLGGLGLLSIVMAFFYGFMTNAPHHPSIALLAFAVACGLVLALYETVLRLLSR